MVSRTLQPRSYEGLSLQGYGTGHMGRRAMSPGVGSAGVMIIIWSVDRSQRASGGKEWAVGFGARIEELLSAASAAVRCCFPSK